MRRFLVGLYTPQEGVAKLHHVHSVLKRNLTTRVLCVVTESAVTFTAGYPVRQVQVVLRRFASPTDVLSSFDVDCCAFAFDGTRAMALTHAPPPYRHCLRLPGALCMALTAACAVHCCVRVCVCGALHCCVCVCARCTTACVRV